MNIFFLTTHINTGGITSYLMTLSKGLINRGHGVHIASSGGNMHDEFSSIGAKLLTLDIKTKSILSFKLYKALAPFKKYIKENKLDISLENDLIRLFDYCEARILEE